MTYFLISVLFSLSIASCDKSKSNNRQDAAASYDSLPTIKPVLPMIKEISGIADSKLNPGHLLAHEDGGNPTQLYLIKHNGSLVKTFFIDGVNNRDWEDMAIAADQVYIADIGDNQKEHSEYVIYRFAEPTTSTDTIKKITTIRFKYPDGSHDAEAILVDPTTKDIYIITKNDDPANVYKLAYPYSTTALNVATQAGKLSYSGIVGAAISPNGSDILIKTYLNLFLYNRKAGQTIAEALQGDYQKVLYIPEPQGEAVAFSNNNNGYFTLSEKGFSTKVDLYFYKRK